MSYLYAIQMLIPDYYEPVKIGFSTDPERRKNAFTRGPFPTRFLGTWEAPKGVVDERDVHVRFERFRLYGEWFYPAPEILEFIESVITNRCEVGAKLQSRIGKFHERLDAFNASLNPPPSPPETPPAPIVSELRGVDTFGLPDTRTADYLQNVRARWPNAHAIKINALAEVTGLSVDAIAENVDYIGLRANTPKHHRRYLYRLLERCIRQTPSLIPGEV